MKHAIAALSVAAAVVLVGCGEQSMEDNERITSDQLAQYNRVQPVPFYDYSAHRETVRAISDAQANGTATTTFFFAMTGDPVRTCPSVGYPVASTTQLTSPDQHAGNGIVLSMMEPTGVYTGESTGTYAVCVEDGNPAPEYWEGFVYAVPFPARWEDGRIVKTGPASVEVDIEGPGGDE